MRSDMHASDLRESTFRASDLEFASLVSANLRHSDLRKVNFRLADLEDTDLVGANLAGADLSEANLKNADLREADLSGVVWRNIKAIDSANVYGVKNAPEGFLPWAMQKGAISKPGGDE